MLHKNIPAGDVHVVANWVVANAAARIALTPVTADIGKVCWQQDDDSFWVCKATTPTWAQIGAPGNLNSLTDVTITAPSNGQILSYNGSTWVNGAASGGGASTFASRFLLMGA